MKKLSILLGLILTIAVMSGCESSWGSAGLGAAGGAAAGAGGYEYKANKEMDRIEEAYKAGEMDQREYEIRKDQIRRMSILE
jgi:hypothetical protein